MKFFCLIIMAISSMCVSASNLVICGEHVVQITTDVNNALTGLNIDNVTLSDSPYISRKMIDVGEKKILSTYIAAYSNDGKLHGSVFMAEGLRPRAELEYIVDLSGKITNKIWESNCRLLKQTE